MNLGQIRLYDLFRKELMLPDNKAADFVSALGDVCEWQADGMKELFAKQGDMDLVKSDIHILKSDVNILKSDVNILKSDVSILKNDVSILKSDVSILKGDVSILKSDVSLLKDGLHSLDLKIERYKGETIKAIYWVGLAQFITIVGSLIAILKFVR